MLLTIVVYIYTVIAFNFFRKFYVQEEDDQVDQKCHNMLTVGFTQLQAITNSLSKLINFLICVVFRISPIQRRTSGWGHWRRNRIA